ncbi:interferon alpha-inducible protein 27-like protein 2A isoform X3 [Dicentrarchus labrax]|uniref:interferon alpha-inducible protein 27-like protein 2A isoform X3 n=1 Tax=Dicentrarchus labrax TaxID=13489 RepID=UPI0021F537AB|nr:interferon alpha-inducible protein 27-like protein 2A isoform X3 [Dicentrarchus labrax]
MEDICYKTVGMTCDDICKNYLMDRCEELCQFTVMGGGALAFVALLPVILAFIGFTSGGIAAGSIAAKMMSYFAIIYGGGVPAGGLVAFLQSLGAAGFSTGAAAGTGATAGWLLSAICNQTGTH